MNNYTICDPVMIGDYIRVNREILDLSAKQLAMILNVSPAAVSGWETGDKTPDILKCCVLAQLFGVTIDEFYSCIYSSSISFTGSKLYDYLIEKNNNKISINNMSKKSQQKIVSNLINSIKTFMKIFDDIMLQKEINIEEFDYLSSLLKFNIRFDRGPYIISLVEKVDADFNYNDLRFINNNVWDFSIAEPITSIVINKDFNYENFLYTGVDDFTELLSSGMLIISDEKIEVEDKISYNKRITGDIFDLAYVKDKRGRTAQIKIFEFKEGCSFVEITKLVNKYNTLNKNSKKIYDFLHFDIIEDFLDILYKQEFVPYLSELLKMLGIEMKRKIFRRYIEHCKSEELGFNIEILYHYLINNAINDQQLIVKVIKAIHDNIGVLSINIKEEEECLNINRDVHVTL